MGKTRMHRVLIGMLEGKKLLGSPRYRWNDNIKMNLKELGWEGTDWTNVAEDKDR
jgi:hypothetical protein